MNKRMKENKSRREGREGGDTQKQKPPNLYFEINCVKSIAC